VEAQCGDSDPESLVGASESVGLGAFGGIGAHSKVPYPSVRAGATVFNKSQRAASGLLGKRRIPELDSIHAIVRHWLDIGKRGNTTLM